MPDPSCPVAIANRIEAALARVEAATQRQGAALGAAEHRAALLERHGQEALAALDTLLVATQA